jgi:hypothetical protein
MFFMFVSHFKRVLFPGINVKDLKSVSFLLSPRDLVVPLSIVAILAQVSDNIRGLLNYKEIQKLRIRFVFGWVI